MQKGRKIPRYVWLYGRMVLVVLFLSLVGMYFFVLKDLPSPTGLLSTNIPQSTQIFDRNDKLLYTIYGNRNQTFIPLRQLPKKLQQATIAIEDKDFYNHGAIDIRGIARAFVSTVFHKQIQGGSTLTQQLVKNSLLTPEQTIPRKVKEIVLAFATEALYPKDKILEMYLNQVPYGGTAWGVEAAAQTYFGKHVQDLTLAESALIAGLPEAPTTLSPFGARPELAKQRQEEVLTKMYEQKYITKDELDQAIKEKLSYKKISNSIQAPHFVLYVKDLLERKYGQRLVEEGGLKVKTSLDLSLQDYAEASLAAELDNLKSAKVGNGAALVTIPESGEILAMVGSKDYFGEPEPPGCVPGKNCVFEPNVNLTTSKRQPGSSIKPINYATGLIKGYSAATPFVDKDTCFPNLGGQPAYCPKNYDGTYHGVVQMRFALANSYNIPAVKMLKLNGLDAMIATASAMGITTFTNPERYGLSLTLGGGEVYMTEMATAYGVFANQGYRVDLHPILKVTDTNGHILEKYDPPSSPIFGKKVIPSGVAYIISSILMDNSARTPAFGPSSELRIGNQPVSVKTGTTNDYRDNWTIGYTPSYLVAVWVGNNDNSPMGSLTSGVTGAAPIWHDIMAHLLDGKPQEPPQKPDSVEGRYVCNVSGESPQAEGTPDRCGTRFEYFLKGVKPIVGTLTKQKAFIDKTTNDLAKSGQTDNVEEREVVIATDPTGDRYCLSCSHPELEKPKSP